MPLLQYWSSLGSPSLQAHPCKGMSSTSEASGGLVCQLLWVWSLIQAKPD